MNQMMIGGIGSVPMDLGVTVSKTMFAPRLGATYRVNERTVLRPGFGIANDPYSLARPLRTNHPAVLNRSPMDQTRSRSPAAWPMASR